MFKKKDWIIILVALCLVLIVFGVSRIPGVRRIISPGEIPEETISLETPAVSEPPAETEGPTASPAPSATPSQAPTTTPSPSPTAAITPSPAPSPSTAAPTKTPGASASPSAAVAARASASAGAGSTATATVRPAQTLTPDTGAYLLVSVRGLQYEPIPLTLETEFALRQKDTEAENIIHVTLDSVWMASSSCDNQDCVEQGTVSLANRDMRVLQNMIVCLPNQVMLELLTPAEAEEYMP